MSIFYSKEHIMCSDHNSDIRMNFKYVEVEAGITFNRNNERKNYLIFFLEGTIKVGYNEFNDQIFSGGEIIFLPKSADCRFEVLSQCTLIEFVYEDIQQVCDKMDFDLMAAISRNLDFRFVSLPIKGRLMEFLLLLRCYLQEGMHCFYLHEIKQLELFMLLRIYYRKEELALLFFSVLGKSMEFRSKVMSCYLIVKTARELANACGYSESRFYDLFINEFGQSPYQWMQKQKSKHILGRLSQFDIPIKSIVDEFHFSCPSHFNKYCKAHFGATPMQVRQQLHALPTR